MAYFNSRGLRGSTLEGFINLTNDVYREKNLAIIQKIPTPITPVKISSKDRTITLAYFNEKSTVDYMGVVQGIPVCFDAKETSKGFLPLQNIHQHQVDFMQDFEKQEGIAFMLVYFKMYDEYYYLPFKKILKFWEESKNGGRKSIPYKDFDKKYIIKQNGKFYVHYLEALNTYLKEND
ncbi:MAG: Holliday junction resolvase RecU [Clostridiales bacterium]|nr:Holliday junction resolvase RecU [Clostridiales bacterium]